MTWLSDLKGGGDGARMQRLKRGRDGVSIQHSTDLPDEFQKGQSH